jgi:pimeloyl-ACP methyl ester carboxylesterase
VKRLTGTAAPSGVTAALRAMAGRRDHTGLLPKIKAPILILAGKEDAVIPAEETRRMRRAAPRATLRFVPRAGHLLNLECPDLFAESLLKFISRID